MRKTYSSNLVGNVKKFKSGLSEVFVSRFTTFFIGQDYASKAYYVWTNGSKMTKIDNMEEYVASWKLAEI